MTHQHTITFPTIDKMMVELEKTIRGAIPDVERVAFHFDLDMVDILVSTYRQGESTGVQWHGSVDKLMRNPELRAIAVQEIKREFEQYK